MSSEENKLVLVTGATGQQGNATAKHLLRHGFRVRALTRYPDAPKAKALASIGAEVAEGDFDRPESIRVAIAGAWGVFSVQNTHEAGEVLEEEQGLRLAQIARAGGVQHFVYTSVASSDRNTGVPHFENKRRIELFVRRLDFPTFTIIRPVQFMDSFLSTHWFPELPNGKLVMAIQPETVVQMIAADDIGRFALLAFQRPDEMNGLELDIAGDEQTMPRTAEILGRAMGKKVEYVQVPMEEVPEAFALAQRWYDAVGWDVDISALSHRFGRQLTSLEQWAQQAFARSTTLK